MKEIMPIDENVEQFLIQEIKACLDHLDLNSCINMAVDCIKEKVDPDHVWDVLDLARKKIMEGQYHFGYIISLAVQKCLPFDQGGVKPYYYAAISAHKLKRFRESKNYYERTIALEPLFQIREIDQGRLETRPAMSSEELSQVHHNFATLLNELGDIARAKEHYQEALSLDRNNAASHNDYASLIANEPGHEQEAEKHYREAISLGLPKAYFSYANLLSKLGRDDEAETYYKSSLKLNPQSSKSHFNYAILLGRQRREKEAEDHYKKAIESNPKNIEARNNLADLLRKDRRFSEAEQMAKSVLDLEPENSYVTATLGDILADEGYLEEAEKTLRAALISSYSLEPYFISQIHNSIGSVFVELDNYDRARREFKKALDYDSKNQKAIRNLRRLNLLVANSENPKFILDILLRKVKAITIGPTGISLTFERETINRLMPSKPTLLDLER